MTRVPSRVDRVVRRIAWVDRAAAALQPQECAQAFPANANAQCRTVLCLLPQHHIRVVLSDRAARPRQAIRARLPIVRRLRNRAGPGALVTSESFPSRRDCPSRVRTTPRVRPGRVGALRHQDAGTFHANHQSLADCDALPDDAVRRAPSTPPTHDAPPLPARAEIRAALLPRATIRIRNTLPDAATLPANAYAPVR